MSTKDLKGQKCSINPNNKTINFCVDNDCSQNKYPNLNFNLIESNLISKNKTAVIDILKSYNIPTPNYVTIDRLGYQKINPRDYPIVLKPIELKEGLEEREIFTDIENLFQFAVVRDELLKKYEKIMMENQIMGKKYRIFIFQNKVMDVIEKKHPFVVTDGIHTIQELVNIRNDNLIRNGKYPTKDIHQVTLQKQGVNLHSIPPENQQIYLSNTTKHKNGSEYIHLHIKNIPHKNIDLFLKTSKVLGLECSVIDYISTDIMIPYDINKGHIIDVNDMLSPKIEVLKN